VSKPVSMLLAPVSSKSGGERNSSSAREFVGLGAARPEFVFTSPRGGWSFAGTGRCQTLTRRRCGSPGIGGGLRPHSGRAPGKFQGRSKRKKRRYKLATKTERYQVVIQERVKIDFTRRRSGWCSCASSRGDQGCPSSGAWQEEHRWGRHPLPSPASSGLCSPTRDLPQRREGSRAPGPEVSGQLELASQRKVMSQKEADKIPRGQQRRHQCRKHDPGSEQESYRGTGSASDPSCVCSQRRRGPDPPCPRDAWP
jgi:hypothetical protein